MEFDYPVGYKALTKEAACGEALKQIEEKKYAEGLKRRGAKKIIKYGIAFCEKECMVVMA